ncbi:hypothetical protein DRP53_02700 [candidate division WOR-3 bacterium]|uniref:Peptidase M28 domain-containing protein n=1 Tax=candidate division WOR-3 bacterium TaxID=2052148 RepID=A0A660SKS7_UNCW3|nr:MAG: hypothetical protein DRP53_02700 [candidate division WOR-3 bacterium]
MLILMIMTTTFLARIDPDLIGEEGIGILSRGEDFAIGLVDQPRPGVEILTTYQPEKIYLWVRPLAGFPLVRLSKIGKIIFQKGDDYLIETDDSTIDRLDLTRLMIARLPERPVVPRPKTEIRKFPSLDPLVQEMVDAVDSMVILDHVRTLQNDFFSRHSRTTGCSLAVAYAAQHFINLGYDSVYYHKYLSNYSPQVIAVKPGKWDDSTYVICGHIDAVISSGPIAYGADDNGSGSSCVMEAARVMAGYEFKHRLVFICFTGEEQGLVGSYYWCRQHQNDPMFGALNFDMIAYMDRPDRLHIISDYQSQWLMNFVDSCAAYYLPGFDVRPKVDPSSRYSDHASFWDIGVAALCHIEYPNNWNPYYHTRGDTIGAGFNDLTFCWKTVKLGVAALASLAEPLGPEVQEEVTSEAAYHLPGLVSGPLVLSDGLSGSVFDISGRRIATGNRFDLPGGIYFIQIEEVMARPEKFVVIR